MDNSVNLIIILAVVAIIILLLVAFAKNLVEYSSAVKYLKMERDRAFSRRERRHWEREITAVRWSIIPGFNPKTVKKIMKKFEKRDGDSSLLAIAISFLGIGLCAVCLTGSTFAWYNASVKSPTQSITSANYMVEPTIVDSKGVYVSEENGIYKLIPETYTIMLSADTEAKTGYCIVNVSGEKMHTQQFPSEINNKKTLTFIITANEEISLSFLPSMGTSSASDQIDDGEELEFGTKQIKEEPDEETSSESVSSEITSSEETSSEAVSSEKVSNSEISSQPSDVELDW